MRDAVQGTGTMLRFFVRRDRLMVLWWTLGGVLLYVSQAVSVDGLYSTQAEFTAAARSMEANVGFIAMTGPPRVLDTVGGQVAWQSSAFGAVLAGLMSMFLVGRHTRAEEEAGREELVRAGAVGRFSTVAATVAVVALANGVLGGAIALGLVAYGLPAAGSVSLGLAAALAGLVFAAVALVAVQAVEGTRAAYGITGAAIGLAYVLRAAGDVAENGLSWASPIGWGQAMRAYAGEVWWPAVLSVVSVALLAVLATVLFDRRDVGAGVWATRRGPDRSDLGAGALSWRLQRGTLLGWAVGMFLVGASYGSIGEDVESVLGNSDLSEVLLAQGAASVTDAFYGTAMLMIAVITAAYAVSSALRPRGEELAGRVEPLLSSALPRLRWALGHTAVTVLGVVVVLLLGGLGAGLVLGTAMGDPGQVGRLTAAAVGYTPAVLVVSAVARLGYGIAPRLGSVGWLALLFCVVVMLFGELWQLPGWVANLSPFTTVATMPVESFAWGPALAVGAVALGLSATGHWALLRRDVATA